MDWLSESDGCILDGLELGLANARSWKVSTDQ